MNDLPKLYFTMERYLFPLLEEELGELTAKMRISFSTAGRRIGRINREDEGIFADCRSGSAVPVHHQCATLVRLGPTDEGPRENASGVFSESGIRLSDDEGAD